MVGLWQGCYTLEVRLWEGEKAEDGLGTGTRETVMSVYTDGHAVERLIIRWRRTGVAKHVADMPDMPEGDDLVMLATMSPRN